MTQSRRRKVLLFSFLSAALFAAPAYSQESIFTSFYEGPFLQCKDTKKVDHGGCVVLSNAEDSKKRCKIVGGPGGSITVCKSEAAVAKSKSK